MFASDNVVLPAVRTLAGVETILFPEKSAPSVLVTSKEQL